MKTALKVIGWNCGLLLALLAAAELIFGGWLEAVGEPELWRLSIYRDVDWRLSVADKYQRAEPVRYLRDHWGLRGRFGRPEDVDVLVVGGSTTDERYVDEAETWIERTNACLGERGVAVRMANGGVAGQSSRGHIRNFDYWYPHVPGLKPRTVLVYLGINEKVLDGRETEDDVRNYNESGRAQWIERAKLKSAVYALVTALRGNMLAWQAGLHSSKAGVENGVLAAEVVDRTWRQRQDQRVALDSAEHARRLAAQSEMKRAELDGYAVRLRTLIAAIRKSGAQPVLATQSAGTFRVQGGVVSGDLDAYFEVAAVNATTLAVCREAGATCLDLMPRLAFEDGDFYDSVHTTAKGSRRVAQAMCDALAGAGLK